MSETPTSDDPVPEMCSHQRGQDWFVIREADNPDALIASKHTVENKQ